MDSVPSKITMKRESLPPIIHDNRFTSFSRDSRNVRSVPGFNWGVRWMTL